MTEFTHSARGIEGLGAAPPASDAPPPRALYVRGNVRWRADLRHGALELTAPHQPARRFPLARLARIVCRTTLDWSGEALGACLAKGIPVLFEDGRGTATGYALPAIDPASPLHDALQRLAGLPAAAHTLDNWLRHRRREVLASWWADWLSRHPESRGALYVELKRRFVYRGEVQAVLEDSLRPICESAVLDGLRRAGAMPSYTASEESRLELLQEITTLLWGQINLESGALAVMAAERRLQLAFLEAWLGEHPEVLRGHLVALAAFVARTLRPWS